MAARSRQPMRREQQRALNLAEAMPARAAGPLGPECPNATERSAALRFGAHHLRLDFIALRLTAACHLRLCRSP